MVGGNRGRRQRYKQAKCKRQQRSLKQRNFQGPHIYLTPQKNSLNLLPALGLVDEATFIHCGENNATLGDELITEETGPPDPYARGRPARKCAARRNADHAPASTR